MIPLLLLLAQEDLARGPYVQSVTSTSAVICWYTATEVEGSVEIDGKKHATPMGTRHEVKIESLKAGTRHTYRVGSVEGSFRTAPGGDETITFVLYGDGRSSTKTHAKVCAAIAARKPDLVVHSGDLVENGKTDKQWDEFFESAKPMLRSTTFFPALGNHERNAPQYFDQFVLPGDERWYSFDYGPAHFVILDSNSSYRDDEKQLAWLKEDLEKSKKPFKFAVYHHPILSTSKSKSRVEDGAKMEKLWAGLFEKGGLTAALQGHNHNYQRAEKNGILYLTSGGGGAPLYPVGDAYPETKFQQSAHHYVHFTVEAKKLTLEAVDLDGKVLDRFSVIH